MRLAAGAGGSTLRCRVGLSKLRPVDGLDLGLPTGTAQSSGCSPSSRVKEAWRSGPACGRFGKGRPPALSGGSPRAALHFCPDPREGQSCVTCPWPLRPSLPGTSAPPLEAPQPPTWTEAGDVASGFLPTCQCSHSLSTYRPTRELVWLKTTDDSHPLLEEE